MTRRFAASLREESASRKESAPSFHAPGLPGLGTQIAQLYYDEETGEARQGNRSDFINLVRFGDGLNPGGTVGHALLLTDVPPLMEPLEAALLLAEYAHRPGPAFAWNVRQIDYLAEMGEILGVSDWYAWGAICFAHPLRFDRDVADKFARRTRVGVPAGLTAMPVAGITTPVTVEGFVVVAAAEHLATWMAARAINPAVALGGSMWAGTVDMATGEVSYSAPDAMYYAFATVEFLRRWCGINIPVGGGEYCSAKRPGLYTALEKAYKAMTIAAFSGQHPEVGSGLLDNGRMISRVQLLLERELSAALGCFAHQLDPVPERIAMESILEVGLGLRENYLRTEHTLRHYRQSLWLPRVMERVGWEGPASETRAVRQALEQVQALTAAYRKPEGREEQLAAMRAVAERARRDLLGG
jgi:trimethylamine:corrinoid methyltransferase-like protein